jgi:UDP-glucose 4,6-dehydratase
MFMHNHKVVLITGGCGAIGSVVVNYLKKLYTCTRFVNIDSITYCARRENIEPPYSNYVLYEGDICNVDFIKYIFRVEKPSLVIHLAAETHVDQSFGNSFRFTQTNIMGTHTLLECIRHIGGVQLFIHMSTDEVYGSVNDDEISTEQSMFSPSNPYSATKAGAEMICHAFMKSFNLPIIIVRCNNAISPCQHTEKLIPQCIDCILNDRKIQIHGEGKSKRTFIHATDIANALDIISEKGINSAIYNIGTQMEYDVISVVKEIVHQMTPGKNFEDCIKYIPDRAFQDYRYSIDSTALRSLGWTETISFEDAIRDVIQYKTNLRI